MTTAENIKINYYTKAAYEQASSFPCPRSASDVYNLGISMQYCVRAKLLEIAALTNDNTCLNEQASQQLTIKAEIEKLAAFDLDVRLGKFYAMGGPVMEDPVTKEMAQQAQPFFSRITSRFLETSGRNCQSVFDQKNRRPRNTGNSEPADDDGVYSYEQDVCRTGDEKCLYRLDGNDPIINTTWDKAKL